jgi:L-threonylcarbamoyladenylate synthase
MRRAAHRLDLFRLRAQRKFRRLAIYKKSMTSQRATAEILATHTPELFALAVRRAAAALRAGEVVALPTETVYGLAAKARDAQAVASVYEIKGRPAHNPIIVHVASVEMAKRCVRNWPGSATKLAKAFWPGPLTLVLPKSDEIPEIVTAGGTTVGVRWPGHPFMQAVIRECDFPLAAPSANLSNRLSPTNAGHVLKQLGGKLRLIVDGGQSQVGIESTVLDLTASPPRVLRPGMIHIESLAAVVGRVQSSEPRSQGHESGIASPGSALRSPGLLARHYAPKARLVMRAWRDDAGLEEQIRRAESKVARSKVHVIAHTSIPAGKGFGRVSVIPHDAEAFARAIYAELHRCDEAGAELIVVETPPDEPAWAAVADRLRRAASGIEPWPEKR